MLEILFSCIDSYCCERVLPYTSIRRHRSPEAGIESVAAYFDMSASTGSLQQSPWYWEKRTGDTMPPHTHTTMAMASERNENRDSKNIKNECATNERHEHLESGPNREFSRTWQNSRGCMIQARRGKAP